MRKKHKRDEKRRLQEIDVHQNELDAKTKELKEAEIRYENDLKSLRDQKSSELDRMRGDYEKVITELQGQKDELSRKVDQLTIFKEEKKNLENERNLLQKRFEAEENYINSEQLRQVNEKIQQTTYNSELEKENMNLEKVIRETKDEADKVKKHYEIANIGSNEKMLELLGQLEVLEKSSKNLKMDRKLGDFQEEVLQRMHLKAGMRRNMLGTKLKEHRSALNQAVAVLKDEIASIEAETLAEETEFRAKIGEKQMINDQMRTELEVGEALAKSFWVQRKKVNYFFLKVEELFNVKNPMPKSIVTSTIKPNRSTIVRDGMENLSLEDQQKFRSFQVLKSQMFKN
jgi:hypothetical protein